jgi:hypothetical protein
MLQADNVVGTNRIVRDHLAFLVNFATGSNVAILVSFFRVNKEVKLPLRFVN